jgi:hypothetical protein
MAAIGQPGSQILALRMAPDNVRAALLVRTKSVTKLLLAAVQFDRGAVALGQAVSIGAGVASPVAISWSDPYHLAVLASSGIIFAVPLTGGAGPQAGGLPQPLGTAPGGAQTLTTDGSELVVGVADGGVNRIFASSPASPLWYRYPMPGSVPVYPG